MHPTGVREDQPGACSTPRIASVLAALLVLLAGCAMAKPWQPLPASLATGTMEPDKAFALYQAWKKDVGHVKYYATGVRMQPDGSFLAIHGIADFDYDAKTKTLKVMRVLTRGSVRRSQETDPGIVKKRALAKQEPWSLGGAQFYINPHPWLDENEKVRYPDMNTFTLMREFNDNNIDPKRFVTDVSWLVFWAEYWYPRGNALPGLDYSGSDRAFMTPEEQAKTRIKVEAWARKILPKPEPPTVNLPL